MRDIGPRHLTATIQHRSTSVLGNAIIPYAPQYVPSWIRPSVLASTPFDWSVYPQTTHLAAEAQRLAAIDFNTDGIMDIVTADYWNPSAQNAILRAYQNDGKGKLT